MPQHQETGRETTLFRNIEGQALHIPSDYEIPVDRMKIRKDGDRLINEPVQKRRYSKFCWTCVLWALRMNFQRSTRAFCLPRKLSCNGIVDA